MVVSQRPGPKDKKKTMAEAPAPLAPNKGSPILLVLQDRASAVALTLQPATRP